MFLTALILSPIKATAQPAAQPTTEAGVEVRIKAADPTLDLGDAPDPTYPTLIASNGPRHVVGSNIYLGTCVDAEFDGQPTVGADGDDANAGTPVAGVCTGDDDEDGVTFTSLLVVGSTATISVVANEACDLSAWIDFNGDGDWNDVGEELFSGLAIVAGVNNLSFPVPTGAVIGTTYARFRCTTFGALTPTGPAINGEVEDYLVTIDNPAPAIDLLKDVSATTSGNGIYSVIYTLIVTNTGNLPLTNLQVRDDLSVTFAAAVSFYDLSISSPDFTVNPAYDGTLDINLLTGTDTMAIGASGRILINLTLNTGGFPGPYDNLAEAIGVGGGVTVTDTSDIPLNAAVIQGMVPGLGTVGIILFTLVLMAAALYRMRTFS